MNKKLWSVNLKKAREGEEYRNINATILKIKLIYVYKCTIMFYVVTFDTSNYFHKFLRSIARFTHSYDQLHCRHKFFWQDSNKC